MFSSNQTFLLVQKLKSTPKGFTSKVKAKIEKIFSICPKLLINAKFYGLILAPRLRKQYHQIWEADLQPLGPMLNFVSQSLHIN
jgi:hypothetical protein